MTDDSFILIWRKDFGKDKIKYWIENSLFFNIELNYENIEKVYSQNIPHPFEFKKTKFGIFNSTDEIDRFSFHLCQSLNFKSVILVSQELLNVAYEKSSNKDFFINYLIENGNKIDNPDYDKKNLIQRFFN